MPLNTPTNLEQTSKITEIPEFWIGESLVGNMLTKVVLGNKKDNLDNLIALGDGVKQLKISDELKKFESNQISSIEEVVGFFTAIERYVDTEHYDKTSDGDRSNCINVINTVIIGMFIENIEFAEYIANKIENLTQLSFKQIGNLYLEYKKTNDVGVKVHKIIGSEFVGDKLPLPEKGYEAGIIDSSIPVAELELPSTPVGFNELIKKALSK